MKRIFSVFFTLVVVLTTLTAMPARRGQWVTIRLADGTETRAQLRGDEHLHYYETADGTCYVADGDSYVVADMGAMRQRAQARRQQADVRRQARKKVAQRAVGHDYRGRRKGLIILVQFTDVAFAAGHDRQLFSRVANEEGFSEGYFKGSVSDYFKAQSGGVFQLDFDVVGPVQLSNNVKYYGRDSGGEGNDIRPGQMVAEACKAVADEVDFSQYDWSGDGEVEQVYVLYAGKGQADGGSANTIWPHEWDLESSDYGKTLEINGVTINTYACGSELDGTGSLCGIGTMCHEFSHCLGLPDMYDTEGDNFGMAVWDLMDYGSYNDDGYQPSGYTSYEKWFAGWLQPTELNADTQVSGMKPLSEGGEAYVIYNQNHPDEYYLLENRQRTGWDASLYGSGLLVLHVDYNEQVWYENRVNTVSSRQRCTIIHADNDDRFSEQGFLGDPYPYYGKDSLTNLSVPAAKLYNKNSDGSRYMNCTINKIKQNADGTMSFSFSTAYTPMGGGSAHSEEKTLFYESFDKCAGSGGNDNLWEGLRGRPSLIPDNEGWEGAHLFGGNKCARVGVSKGGLSGVITSPSIEIDGETVLTFRAAPWASETDALTLFVVEGDGTISPNAFELEAGQWVDCTATLDGQGPVKITFVGYRRFFLDEVKVVSPATTAIRTLPVRDVRKTGRIYTLDGRYVGLDSNALPSGIYIVDGKKFVK